MKETLEAVYENGVFRPLKHPEGIAEHRQVTLTVTAEDRPSSLADLSGRISADDAEEMRGIVERDGILQRVAQRMEARPERGLLPIHPALHVGAPLHFRRT